MRVVPACTVITSDMGNHAFQTSGVKHLSCIPEITFIPYDQLVRKDSYLFIASDGLWEHVNSKQFVSTFRELLKSNDNLLELAKKVLAGCYHAGEEKFIDDTTLIIVPL